MNTKQKLHQIKLQQWAIRFQEQASSGLTVRAWCAENNITIHTYNYWKHKLKQEYVEASLTKQHDIVPITTTVTPLTLTPVKNFSPLSCQLRDSHESHNTISIFIGEVAIQAADHVSDEYLLRILKAVRHA